MAIDRQLRARAEEARRRLRRRHSDSLSPGSIPEYVGDLLPLELACARSDSDPPPRLPSDAVHGCTLVLVVGFSIEPLLQSVSAYQPAEVVLVLNRDYGEARPADSMARIVWSGIRQLHPGIVAQQVQEEPPVVLTQDQPAYAFRELRSALVPRLRSGQRLIVDITGGKKSMVAGAFLFAAFAGLPISYVDFDEYDPQERVPRGYTCRIGELENPYQIFRLKDWERVRELYERHFFRSAGALLDEILASMSGWFEEPEIEATRRLRAAMTMYEQWDNGDFSGAWELGTQLAIPLPSAVQVLGCKGYWPRGDNAAAVLGRLRQIEIGTATLYLDFNKLAVYTYDELAKVRRLIDFNEDWRSALLRAAGITEMLLRSRMLVVFQGNQLEVARGKSGTYQSPQDLDEQVRATIRDGIIESNRVYEFLRVLCDDPAANGRQEPRAAEIKGGFLLRRRRDTPVIRNGCVLEREAGRKLRNKAIHTCLSVPEAESKEALKIAENSAKEFFSTWVEQASTKPAGRLEWGELCRRLGVDFLVPDQ